MIKTMSEAVIGSGLLARKQRISQGLGLQAGDLDDRPSFWAEQRRRLDGGDVKVAILGDSRILYDTDLARFESLTGMQPVQLAIAGSNALPFLEDLLSQCTSKV